MKASREPVIVVALAVLSLCPVMAGIACFPAPVTEASLAPPSCVVDTPYPGSVALTPPSPVLLSTSDQWNVSAEGGTGIGFQLRAPAEFSGAWVATAPTGVFVMNASSAQCIVTVTPPPAQLNGTFDMTLFPGDYVVGFEWSPGANIVVAPTQPWTATFDRGLDVLQGPEQITLPPNGHAAWTITAPSNASRFFLEDAMETNSCHFELAVVTQSVYRGFEAGQGPLNGTGTTVLTSVVGSVPGNSSPCGPSSGISQFWCDSGPFGWTSGDVAVFYNEAGYAASLYAYAPLEISYNTG